MVEELLKELASKVHDPVAGDETARIELYQAIIEKGRTGEAEGETSTSRAFDRQRGAILPVLVKDCEVGSEDVQHLALELLGHLCAMASSCEAPSFQPDQSSSLWGALARLLDDETSKRLPTVLALFAISRHTMEPSLVAPSVARLAPGIARSMRHESTVVRQHSAKAIHRLLGSAPHAMALCLSSAKPANQEEDTHWVRCLLRLCFDDAVLVRGAALSAAERAVSSGCLMGSRGVATWVLEVLKDGSLECCIGRVLLHESQAPAPSALPNAAEHPAIGSIVPSEPSPSTKAPSRMTSRNATAQRVKQAIRAWAVHLSLADLTSLLETRPDERKKYMDTGTALILNLSGKFSDRRDSVRVQAVKAWEMFATNMMAQCSRDQATQSGLSLRLGQARKVAHMFLTVLAKRVLKDRGAARDEAMSAVAELVASFPSPFFRHLWVSPTPASSKDTARKTQGLSEVLRMIAGGDGGTVVLHLCARILADLLPWTFGLGPEDARPLLRNARLNLDDEISPLLDTLETLMGAIPAPAPQDAASMIYDESSPLSYPGEVSKENRATARLEGLPTAGLIANAWCGLAFWTMERAAAADFPDDEVSKSKGGDGEGKGKSSISGGAEQGGNGTSSCSSMVPFKQKDDAAAIKACEPLPLLLGWLLGGVAGAQMEVGSQGAPTKPAGDGSKNRGDRLCKWKVALLAALIRGLSRRLSLSKARMARTDDDRGQEGKVQVAEPPEQRWLDVPVYLSSLHSGTPPMAGAGASTIDPTNTPREVVIRDCLRRAWAKGGEISGSCNDENVGVCDQTGKHGRENPPSSQYHLWLVLFEGVLRGTCGFGHLRSRDMDGITVSCNSKSSSSSGNRGSSAVQNSSGGTSGGSDKCHNSESLLPPPVLTDALALSPKGWSALVLASLLRGVLKGTDDVLLTCPDGEGKRQTGVSGDTQSFHAPKNRREDDQDLALTLLGLVWRAEAARVLLGWKICRMSPLDSSARALGMSGVGGSQGEALGEDWCVGIAMAPGGGPSSKSTDTRVHQHQHQHQHKHQPSDQLRLDTGNALRFLVQAACSLLSHPPPRSMWNCDGGGGGEAEAAGDSSELDRRTATQNAKQGESCEVAGVAAKQLPGVTFGTLSPGDWSQKSRRSATVKAAFGADIASLWSDLFEARRTSRTHAVGFSRLLRAIAKDCGKCALSSSQAERGACNGSGALNDDGRESSMGWGLVFSQTQSQQQRAGERDGVGRLHSEGAGSPTAQGGRRRQAAARSVDCKSNASLNPGQAQSQGSDDMLAPPPPVSSLPVLTAAASALLKAAPNEADAKSRGRAWKAGLATLAWTLTSITADTIRSSPRSAPSPPPPTSNRLSIVTAREEEAATAIADTCRCLGALRSHLMAAVTSASSTLPRTTTFLLDEESLAPVSQLLAVAVNRSYSAKPVEGVSLGMFSSTTYSQTVQVKKACTVVAAEPSVRAEIRSLVSCVLSTIKGIRPEVLTMSPGLLLALCPVLEAVLGMPTSSDSDTLQTSLLEMWNATFGNLNIRPSSASGGRDRQILWKEAFRPALLRSLSALSQRAEVRMPCGIVLPALAEGGVTNTAAAAAAAGGGAATTAAVTAAVTEPSRRPGLGSPDSDKDAVKLKESTTAVGGRGDEGERKPAQKSRVVGDLRVGAASATTASGLGRLGNVLPGIVGNSGVAGVLPAAGARRSFLGRATSSSSLSGAVANPKKRSQSSTARADSIAGGSSGKFVRVIGSGTGSATRTPTRRAAVTTHTSLDGSQSMAPWDDGSQLPDTDPDSVQGFPDEEELSSPKQDEFPTGHKLSSGLSCTSSVAEHGNTSTSTVSPGGTTTSPSKRSLQDAEFEALDPKESSKAAATAAATTMTTPLSGASTGAGLPCPSERGPTCDRRVRRRTDCADAEAVAGSDRNDFSCPNQSNGSVEGEAPPDIESTEMSAAAPMSAPVREGKKAPINEEERLHATMLAIAKATSSGGVREDERRKNTQVLPGPKDGSQISPGETEPVTPLSHQREESGGKSTTDVEALVQEVRHLAGRLKLAKSVMSPAHLKEVASLLGDFVAR